LKKFPLVFGRHLIYLWSKVVCLFLFCFILSCWDLSTHGAPCQALHAVLLIPSKKLLMSRGVPTWFETVWSYSVEAIDYWTIFSMKLYKIETENCIGIWRCSWCCWKAFGESDLIEFVSQFLELICGRYWFLSEFCCWKFQQIAKKLGLEGKISWALNVFYIFFLIENVFTLGPMAQATLVFMNIHFIKEEGSYICAYKRSEKVWMWIESFW
jgi:hypothetical protein